MPERSGTLQSYVLEGCLLMSKTTGTHRTASAIIAIAAVLVLFPPLHWVFGHGWWSLAYIVGSSTLVAALVLVLNKLTATTESGE